MTYDEIRFVRQLSVLCEYITNKDIFDQDSATYQSFMKWAEPAHSYDNVFAPPAPSTSLDDDDNDSDNETKGTNNNETKAKASSLSTSSSAAIISTGVASSTITTTEVLPVRVVVRRVSLVATWAWDGGCDSCAICHNQMVSHPCFLTYVLYSMDLSTLFHTRMRWKHG
jgi:hypothetical protein